MQLKKKLIWSAMFTATLGLTGCFNSSSSGSSSNSSSLSGVVADGYLGNATVCLDINENKSCDPGEPTTTTADDGTGSYSINATSAQISSAPLLVIVTTSTTDTDLNGGTLNRPYTLAAPAGKGAFISPLTTLIQAEMELNPVFTLEVAENKVRADLGLTNADPVNLYGNFIEKSSESGITVAEKNAYKALYQTAQTVARALSRAEEMIKGLGHAIDEDVLQKMVAEEVSKQLSQLHADSKASIEGGSEVDTDFADTQVDALPVVTFTPEEIEAKKAQYQEANNAEVIPLSNIAQNGLAFMEYVDNSDAFNLMSYEVGVSIILTESGNIKMYESDSRWSPFWLDNFTTDQQVKADIYHVDHKVNYIAFPMTSNANGTLSFISSGGVGYERIEIQQFTEVALSGITNPLKDVVRDYQGDTVKTVTFAEGDLNYQFSYIRTPIVHSENIATQTLDGVCATISDLDNAACYAIEDSALATNFSLNTPEMDTFLTLGTGRTYAESGDAFYIENNIAYSCKYQVDSSITEYNAALRDAGGNILCQTGTKVEFAPVKAGTLADGKPYILVPDLSFDDQIEVEYDAYVANGNRVVALNDSIAKDATVTVGTHNAYNLSAIKRIHEAALAGTEGAVDNTGLITLSTAVTEQSGLAVMHYDFNANTTTGIVTIGIDTSIFVNDISGGIAIYSSNTKWDEVWLNSMLTEQDVKDESLNNLEGYSAQIATLDASGVASFTGQNGASTVQIQGVDIVDLNGSTVLLNDVGSDYQGDLSKTVTFAEGDIKYQFPYIETINASGAVSNDIFSGYNLSAIKRIHEAAAQ